MKIKISIEVAPEELNKLFGVNPEEKEDQSKKEQNNSDAEKVTHEDLDRLSGLAIKLNKAMKKRNKSGKKLTGFQDNNESLWGVKPSVRNLGEDVDLPDTLCEGSPMFAFKHLDATQPYKSAKPKVRRLTKREVDLLVEHMINSIIEGKAINDESGVIFKFTDLNK